MPQLNSPSEKPHRNMLAILLIEAGKNPHDVADEFNIEYCTLANIIRRETGSTITEIQNE